ncbi:MAG: leucyl aminopeptidase [Candidatus Aenigmarchaeota archaeon]|nr:leucyl aminopeptidase [Candidatus Aenigmarchaeota archaeon]
MEMRAVSGSIESFKCDCIIIGVFEEGLDPRYKGLDQKLGGALSSLSRTGEFKGEFKSAKLVTTLGRTPAKNVLLAGLGKKAEYDLEKLRKAAGITAKYARNLGLSYVASNLHENFIKDAGPRDKAQALTEGAALALYQFTKYRTVEKEKIRKLKSLVIVDSSGSLEDVRKGLERGRILSEATNYVRTLVNEPASIMTSLQMEKEARQLAAKNRLKIRVFNKAELEKLGFGGLLAVNRGSMIEPRFIVMEYAGGKGKVAVVGKGITFDSGGLDLKPAAYMDGMKCDKAGACTVMGILKAASELKLPVHVIGVMPVTENMPGNMAYKPGDVVTTYSGKTIEIGNTDAEGRVILSDALSYAEKACKPDAIIDLATLTGACVVALGYSAAGIMGTGRRLLEGLKKAGDETFERVWELPFYEEFKDAIKSEVADVKNISSYPKGEAGAITAAAFLSAFVEATPWAHIDIAGPAWINEEWPYSPKGATGYGVRLVVRFLENMGKG